MSHFYGQIDRSARKTIPTARGHKTTGLLMTARSWEGNITVELGYDETMKKDSFIIRRSEHSGANSEIVARGWMDGSFTITEQIGINEWINLNRISYLCGSGFIDYH